MILRFAFAALMLAMAPQGVGAREVFVSFTFDDVPKSVAEIGLPILAEHDYPATLYVSTKNTAFPGYMNWDDIARAVEHGWEVAAHTHMHGDFTLMSDSEILEDLLTSAQLFAQHGYNPQHFATPFGAFDERVLAIIRRHFLSHRTAWPDGVNTDDMDPYRIHSFAIEHDTTIEEVRSALEDLLNRGSWVVFQLHHLTPEGELVNGQYDTNLFAQIVQMVHERNITVLTVDEALQRLQ